MCYLFSLRSHLVVCLVANLKKLLNVRGQIFFIFVFSGIFFLFIYFGKKPREGYMIRNIRSLKVRECAPARRVVERAQWPTCQVTPRARTTCNWAEHRRSHPTNYYTSRTRHSLLIWLSTCFKQNQIWTYIMSPSLLSFGMILSGRNYKLNQHWHKNPVKIFLYTV